MKIVGFSQLHNELEKGNLLNWIKSQEFCDYIYVYDQGSTDGSLEVYKQHSKIKVIESPINDFNNEILCKNQLLIKLLSEQPDTDWIFWMDGDTILDGRLLRYPNQIIEVLSNATNGGFDSICFGHYNLWRSDTYYRVDDGYDYLHEKVIPFWKNTGNLRFNVTNGLHTSQHPPMSSTCKCEFSLIHRGFATDFQIMKKYDVYKSFGQTGYSLERLLNETTLVVEKLHNDLIPDWFEITDDINPKTKKLIREIYNERL